MSHLLVYFVTLIMVAYGQNGCAYFGTYSNFNGQFDDSGLQNDGKNYYVMDNAAQTDCPGPAYIFYNQVWDNWYLHTSVISGGAISYYYYCDTITDKNDVFSCTNWKYAINDSDIGAFFTSGNCPQATCAEISLDVSAGACSGPMSYIQPNQFSSGGNAPYLIHNEKYAKWICTTDITANWGCQNIGGSFIQTDAGIGFKTPFKDANAVTYNGNPGDVPVQFTCTGDVSLSPTTSEPSISPTKYPTSFPTNTPSKSPTKFPSKSPTMMPSSTPSKNPSTAPSKNPTTSEPSVSPTNVPSKSPTRFPTLGPLAPGQTRPPTQTPSVVPTKSPTEMPTKAPTNVPTQSPLDANQSSPPTKTPTELPIATKSPTNVPTENPAKVPTDITTIAPTESGDGLSEEEEGLFGIGFLKLEYFIIFVVVLFCCLLAICCCCLIWYRNTNKEYEYTHNQTNEMIKTKKDSRRGDDGFEYYE